MDKHVLMKKSLAKALLDAGIQHFDSGGTTQGGLGGFLTPQSTFQASSPSITMQDNLASNANQLYGQNQNVYGQQNNLAQALQAQSQGQGPNPAQAALNQSTGQNIAAQGALMAGQRGAGANAGLIARQAAQQGANTQQQAVGQAATLQAQQQLAAQNQLQNLYQNQAQNALAGQGIQQGALAAQNSALTTGQLGAAQINAQTAMNNANNAASTTGGLLGGIASAIPLIGSLFNKGGSVPGYADGGIASYATPTNPNLILSKNVGDEGAGFKSLGKALGGLKLPKNNPLDPGLGTAMVGDPMDAGGITAAPNPMMQLISGAGPLMMADVGGDVPGRAEVKGDSPSNDTIPALLSPGETVLPRSVTMAPDAPERAKKFVEALQDKQGKSGGYGKVLQARASLKDRVERLEKLYCGGKV